MQITFQLNVDLGPRRPSAPVPSRTRPTSLADAMAPSRTRPSPLADAMAPSRTRPTPLADALASAGSRTSATTDSLKEALERLTTTRPLASLKRLGVRLSAIERALEEIKARLSDRWPNGNDLLFDDDRDCGARSTGEAAPDPTFSERETESC